MIDLKKYNAKLLPCPFCGGSAEILPQGPYVKGLKHWLIRCIICNGSKRCFTNHIAPVVAEWNQRYKG